MKVLCSLATLSVALFLTSCSTPPQPVETTGSTPVLKITRNADRVTPNARRMRANPVHALFDVMLSAPTAPARQQKAQPVAKTQPSEEKSLSEQPRNIQPSAEQRQAAERLLAEAPKTAPTKAPAAPAAPAVETPAPVTHIASSPALPSGGLRMGSILPQEDPASAGNALPPGANTVEIQGLRSPKMPTSLPMDIDGKLKSTH